ncbi:MAG: flagellar protein FlgN [Candidatus Latescibacterota bacterium]
MNDPGVVELVELINEEIRLFDHLLDLLHAQQEAIVANDLEALEASVQEQQRVAAEARRHEARRSRVVDELSGRLEVQAGPGGLRRLIGVLESGPGEELARMRQTLIDLNRRIRAASDNNAFLIRQSMRYTERCLDILTGQAGGRGLYGRSGKTRRGQERAVLNRTA